MERIKELREAVYQFILDHDLKREDYNQNSGVSSSSFRKFLKWDKGPGGFYSDWCHLQEKTIDAIERHYKNKLKQYK